MLRLSLILALAWAVAAPPTAWAQGAGVPAPAPGQPTPVSPPPVEAPEESAYVVGATDVLRITVFDEPTLSGSFRIDLDGSITYPLLGRVDVGRKSVREIESHIQDLLADGYVRRPQVSVEIEQYRSRSIFIMGEVRTPGKYPLQGEVTLLEVLALAGSLTPAASDDVVVLRPRDRTNGEGPALPDDDQSAEVVRVNLTALQSGQLSSNILLQDGDTIFVPPADRFYVSGHVRNPGSYVLVPGMTVQQALAVAGGITERGSNRGIKVRRQVGPNKYEEIGVKLTDKVLPNDTIIVRQRYI